MPEQSSKVELRFSVFNGTSSHCWRFTHFTFDSRRVEDRQLWQEIGDKYRDELQGAWRRIYGFKKLKKIIPVAVCDSLLRSVFRIPGLDVGVERVNLDGGVCERQYA